MDDAGVISLWRIADSVELEASFSHKELRPGLIAWSPTGRHLAGIGQSRNVWVWEVDRLGEAPEVYQGHNATVTALAWQADGTWLATGSADNIVRIWGVPGGYRVANTPSQGGDGISHLAWNPDGLVLLHAAEGRDEVIKLDLGVSEEKQFARFDGPITALAWSADAHSVVVGNAEGRVVVRRTGLPSVSRIITDQSSGLVSVHWSADGGSVLCADVVGRVTVFDAVTAKPTRQSRLGRSEGRLPHAWSHRGPDAVVVEDGQVRILSPKGQRLAGELDLGRVRVGGVAWTDQGKGVLVATGRGEVRRFDFNPGRVPKARVFASGDRSAKYSAVSSSPDGRWVLATGKMGRVSLWSAETYRLLFAAGSHEKGHDERVHDWHPDSGRSATGSNRGVVSIWSVEAQGKLLEFEAHRGPVGTLAWHHNGRRLASAGDNGDIYLWDWELRQNVLTLQGHHGPVAHLAWGPDGRRLASVGRDGTLRVWDATAGILLSSQTLTDKP